MKRKIKIVAVVGARPNYMKVAPMLRAFKEYDELQSVLVHTGQHYDKNMSKDFFRDLGIKKPDYNLEVGSASHAVQTARVMERFEPVLLKEKPELVIVVGDVNSTLACTLVASKLHIKVAHVEAGLRSNDMNMPEEINRKATDAVADYLFTTSKDADENLINEGVDKKKIFFVGNCMIDTLVYELKKIKENKPIRKGEYAVMTLHRPSNVDDSEQLEKILKICQNFSRKMPIVFPIHPRTKARIKEFNLEKYLEHLEVIDPLPYQKFVRLYKDSSLVITDSGGIQEETSWLGIPCVTLRSNTERPVTIWEGTNILVGRSEKKIKEALKNYNMANIGRKKIKYWDGKASLRIAKKIISLFK